MRYRKLEILIFFVLDLKIDEKIIKLVRELWREIFKFFEDFVIDFNSVCDLERYHCYFDSTIEDHCCSLWIN